MRDHSDLQDMNARSLAQQASVRRATFDPGVVKALRPFSIWEISQFMFDIPPTPCARNWQRTRPCRKAKPRTMAASVGSL